jgi:hypothetical protein
MGQYLLESQLVPQVVHYHACLELRKLILIR